MRIGLPVNSTSYKPGSRALDKLYLAVFRLRADRGHILAGHDGRDRALEDELLRAAGEQYPVLVEEFHLP